MSISGLNLRFVGTGARRLRCSSFLSTVLVAGTALLGLGVGACRCAAGTFPGGPDNEHTNTFAAVRVTVSTDPDMTFLVAQGTYPKAYVGWNAAGHTLTTPGLYDQDTRIGISDVKVDVPAFGFPVGIAGIDLEGRTLSQRTIIANPNPNYFGTSPGARELYTEIQRLTLIVGSNCPSTDGRVASDADLRAAGLVPWTMVKGGADNGVGNGTVPFRSLGLMRSTTGNPLNDFPANSFFDVYVEVTLPAIPGTASGFYFPSGGAVLTNDRPLIVSAMNLMSVPPATVYYHEPPINNLLSGDPWPVNLKFKADCLQLDGSGHPYYRAGDVFGTILLAGHGTFPCSAKSAVSDFLDTVFGKIGQLAPGAVPGAVFPNSLYPWPESTYESAMGTNFDGSSVDAVGFSNSVSTIFVRNISIGGFADPIALPLAGNSAVYTNLTVAANLEISDNTNTFYPAIAAGDVQVLLVNTNPSSGNVTSYYAQILSLDLSGTEVNGDFMMRQSPTKASTGLHVVETLSGGGYKIGGYFDTTMEYSINDGVSWRPATRPIRIVLGNAPCGANSASLSGNFIGPSTVMITWKSGSYRLQGKATLSGSDPWGDISATSPYLFSLPSAYHFFRLVCP